MISSNVFVEEFTSVLPPRMMPIASKEDIQSALNNVDEANKLYCAPNGKPNVNEDWHAAAMLDFGDWLCEHLPDDNEATMCRAFAASETIKQYTIYAAAERVEALQNELGDPDLDIYASGVGDIAPAIAGALCSDGCPMTIFAASGDHVDTFFLPALKKSKKIDDAMTAALNNETFDGIDRMINDFDFDDHLYFAGFEELLALTALFLNQPVAAMAVIQHHEGELDSLCAMTFANGRVLMLPTDQLGDLTTLFVEGDTDFLPMIELFMPRSGAEMQSRDIAGCLATVVSGALHVLLEDTVPDADGRGELSLTLSDMKSPVPYQVNMDEKDIIGIPSEVFEKPTLAETYFALYNMPEAIGITETTRMLSARILQQSAVEIILTSGTFEISNMVSDFSLEMSLDDRLVLEQTEGTPIYNFIEMVDIDKQREIYGDIYKDLDDAKKKLVDDMICCVSQNGNAIRRVLMLDGDLDDGTSAKLTAETVLCHPGMPQSAKYETDRSLTMLFTKAVTAQSKSTAFISVRDFMNGDPNHVNLYAFEISQGGKTKNLGDERTVEILSMTNIDAPLEINPFDDLEYIDFIPGSYSGEK